MIKQIIEEHEKREPRNPRIQIFGGIMCLLLGTFFAVKFFTSEYSWFGIVEIIFAVLQISLGIGMILSANRELKRQKELS